MLVPGHAVLGQVTEQLFATTKDWPLLQLFLIGLCLVPALMRQQQFLMHTPAPRSKSTSGS